MKHTLTTFLLGVPLVLAAQNPVIRDQFSADPTARVFNNKVYIYPSHDIDAPTGNDRLKEWFCMADYHVFSSENLTDWTDHGVILSQEQVPWGNPEAYSMWAPDCVEKDGKYYFYYPNAPKGETRGFAIGVAVADRPAPDIVAEHVHGRLDFQAAVVGLLQFVRLGRTGRESERCRSEKKGYGFCFHWSLVKV